MIAASAMPTLPPVPPAGDASTSSTPADAPPQNTQSTNAAASSSKSAPRAEGKTRPSQDGHHDNAFDRMLEPEAAPPPAGTSAPQATPTQRDDARASAKDTAPATPLASLADQLLGLLGALPGAAAPTAGATPAPALPASAGTPAASAAAPTAAKPQATGGSLAALSVAPAQTTPAPAPAAGKAEGGPFAALLPGIAADRATADPPTPVAADTAAIASRDATPFSALTPTPPTAVDKLPAVPQPALVQPSDPRSGYGDELGSSVVWMAEHRLGHAQLQVSPDHLGPIEVRLQIDGARVHAEFFSAQSDVRHALESSLPRLRELLGQQGLQLGQADVGQRQRGNTPHAPTAGSSQGDCFPDDARPLPSALRRARGLVDEYA